MTATPSERLVISYLDDEHYHREIPDEESKPVCDPARIRGVLAIRTQVERHGQTPCPECWPDEG